MYGNNYFARSYFGAVLPSAPPAPRVIGMVTELISMGEEALKLEGLNRLLAEGAGASEAISRALVMIRRTAAATSVAEGRLAARVMARLVAATVRLSELFVRSRVMARLKTEVLNLSEVTLDIVTLIGEAVTIVFSEMLRLAETRRPVRVMVRRAAETLRLTELTRRTRAAIKALVFGAIRIGTLIMASIRVNR